MPKNAELRQLGSSQEFDQLFYPVTTPTNLVGFLDESDKIKSEYFPSYIFGHMRKADHTITTDKTTNAIFTLIDTFVTNNEGEHAGVYLLVGSDVEITVSTDHSVNKSHHNDPITSGTFQLQAGDWIVLDSYSDPNVIFSIVNNTYRDGTTDQKGIVQLDNNVSDVQTTAATPKAIDDYAEPKFSKNTAFNKNFGTANAEVARGDHDHDSDYADIAHVSDTTNPHSVTKTQVGLENVTDDLQVKASDKATNAEAEAGTDDTKWMTPIRTKDAIDYFAGMKVYTSLVNANAAASDHAEGSIVLVETA